MLKKLIWLRWFLLPFGFLHLGIVRFRNFAYNNGFFKHNQLPVPVISIGNVQAGGTGKTPLTLYLIKALQEKGLRIGILSRGYGREASETLIFTRGDGETPTTATAGDEPMELWAAITNGGMGIGSNRYDAGTALLDSCDLDCLLLDDGMQHRQLKRDLDICTIDVSRWFSHPFLLPFSYLRDSKSRLDDASIIILSKWEGQQKRLALVKKDIARYAGTNTIIQKMHYKLSQPETLVGEAVTDGTEKVAVFTGIANPAYFSQSLKNMGYEVALEHFFPDHHSFTYNELESVVQIAAQQSIKVILITEKDAVKIRPLLKDAAELSARFAVVKAHVATENPEAIVSAVIAAIEKQKRDNVK